MRRAPLFLFLALAVLMPGFADAARDVTARGPYTVGLMQMTFTKTSETTGQLRPLDTYIWYPAVRGTGTADEDVFRDATVRKGHWPLVLFSHGLCATPYLSSFYTEVLASWGFVVAAPPHPGNQITDGLSCITTVEDSFANRVADIQFVVDQMLAQAKGSQGPFARRIDPRRIGVSGHSFGGQTALRVAAIDKRMRAALAMAPAVHSFVGTLDIEIPAMIEVGQVDSLAPLETEAKPYFS